MATTKRVIKTKPKAKKAKAKLSGLESAKRATKIRRAEAYVELGPRKFKVGKAESTDSYDSGVTNGKMTVAQMGDRPAITAYRCNGIGIEFQWDFEHFMTSLYEAALLNNVPIPTPPQAAS